MVKPGSITYSYSRESLENFKHTYRNQIRTLKSKYIFGDVSLTAFTFKNYVTNLLDILTVPSTCNYIHLVYT